jgi:hypothetical protein
MDSIVYISNVFLAGLLKRKKASLRVFGVDRSAITKLIVTVPHSKKPAKSFCAKQT